MKLSVAALLVLVACSCSAAPTEPPRNQDPATRAAELAVRVANNTATADEKVELDAFLKGKK